VKLSVEERDALVKARKYKRLTGVDVTQYPHFKQPTPPKNGKRARKYRQTRTGEIVCICPAYKFPHRQLGGKCTPQRWVCHYFNPTKRECKDCHNLNGNECEVLTGQEQPMHCPELRDYIRFEGIALYGRARDLLLRAQRRKAEREVA
jgi:hypothetical protein